MVKHIVWLTMKEEARGGAAAENAAKTVAMLKALDGRIPSLRHIEVTTETLESSSESVDVILQTEHDDAQGLHEYQIHPKHQECAAFIMDVISSRRVIDYVV
jgi:hypothetical protein